MTQNNKKYIESIGMASIFFVLLIIVTFTNVSFSFGASVKENNPTLFFNQGNKAYRNGRFGDAEKLYKKAISFGIENKDLYYNLGNACFKQKKIGWARLYYEKALRLMPGDENTNKNLELIFSLLNDRIPLKKVSFIERIFNKILKILSISGWVWLVDVFYFSLCGFLVFKLLYRKNIRYFNAGLWGTLLLLFISCSLLGGKIYNEWMPQGIIMKKETRVKSAPQLTYPTMFKIHLGTKVIIREKRNNWVFVTFSEKLSGWIPAKNIEYI